MNTKYLAAAILGTLALSLTACTGTTPRATISTPPVSIIPIPAHLAHTAPDGTPIPGGKATWLPNLPDPRQVDRTDMADVLDAVVITNLTWDTTVDKTTAYANQRAAIYATAAQQRQQASYDPDLAKAQSTFIAASAHQGYTHVTVTGITQEGEDSDQGDAVRRIVAYQVTTQPRDQTQPILISGHAWITLTQDKGRFSVDTGLYRTDQQ